MGTASERPQDGEFERFQEAQWRAFELHPYPSFHLVESLQPFARRWSTQGLVQPKQIEEYIQSLYLLCLAIPLVMP